MKIKPPDKFEPEYSLEEVKKFVRAGNRKATEGAIAGALSLGLEEPDIWRVILGLEADSFHKSMAEEMSEYELFLDVYKPVYSGKRIYLKFKIRRGRLLLLIVTSFKER